MNFSFLISQSLISNLFFFFFGISVGSFLNVVIDRLETNESILTGRSHCDSCKHVLRWYDLIPIVSFIFLRGKCRYCGKSLRLQYPLVEFVTGTLFVLVWTNLANGCELFANTHELVLHLPPTTYHLLVVSAMIVVFVYDLKHKIIPDKVILPTVLVSSLYTLYSPFTPFFLNQWFSAIGAGLFFLCLILATKGRGMGMGDVKLVFLMGLVLGWPKILIALYLSFISGALIGLLLIAIGKKRFGQEIPFGPFLSASTIATLLYGNFLLHLFQTFVPIF